MLIRRQERHTAEVSVNFASTNQAVETTSTKFLSKIQLNLKNDVGDFLLVRFSEHDVNSEKMNRISSSSTFVVKRSRFTPTMDKPSTLQIRVLK
jgi:hypothetical protein